MKLDKIKDKENIWKASRENKHITYMGILKSFSADFSAEALQARREWHDILNSIANQIEYGAADDLTWFPENYEYTRDEYMAEKVKREKARRLGLERIAEYFDDLWD